MTEQERTEYQNRMHSLATAQERAQFRLEHQKEMQQRARQQGAKLSSPPTRSRLLREERSRQRERAQIYGYSLMSQQELNQYREQMRAAGTTEERNQVRAEHRKAMQDRARERGVTLPNE